MIDTFDEWLDAFKQPEPRAVGAIFGWCVTDASYDLEPRVLKAQFGDGYAQRRPDGINTQARIWKVEMRNTNPKTAAAVLAFLSARNGVDVFNWTPPRTEQVQDVICPSWSSSYGEMLNGGTRLVNISMTFEQVHQ